VTVTDSVSWAKAVATDSVLAAETVLAKISGSVVGTAVAAAATAGATVARALQPSRDKQVSNKNIFNRLAGRFFILLCPPGLLSGSIQLAGNF
jgi:hypothetical protein